jgi:hypothetical protein
MINTTAIRTAIDELLAGTIGTTRTMKTTEYISYINDFDSWNKLFVTVTPNQAYGPRGEKTADLLTLSNGEIVTDIGTVPDNTLIKFSIYVWTQTGTKNFRMLILKKDGNTIYTDMITATTVIQKFELSENVLSGITTPTVGINGLAGGSEDSMLVAEAHCTSDDYLFGKIEPWDSAVLEPAIDPLDGKLIINTRYKLSFPSNNKHASTPVSAIGSHKIIELSVLLELAHDLGSNVQSDLKNEALERVIYDGDRIMQVLSFADNLSMTSESVETGIISGMLIDLKHDINEIDFEASEPRIKSRITGTALVHVTQPTA